MNYPERIDVYLYLIGVFKKERPGGSVRDFKNKLYKLSDEDLLRIADAITRFGLDNLMPVLPGKRGERANL